MIDEIFQQLDDRRWDIILDRLYSNYDPHDTILLLYEAEDNIFIDMHGTIYHDIYIYDILHPWQIFLFKHHKKNYTFPDVTNSFLVELVYPDYMYLEYS